MRRVSIMSARENITKFLGPVTYSKERVILTRRGEGVAAIIPMEDLRMLEELGDKIAKEDIREMWEAARVDKRQRLDI